MKRRITFLLFLALGGTLAAQAPEAPPSTLTLGYTINGGSREFYVFNTTQEARSGIVVVTLFDKAGNRTGDKTYECAVAPRSNSPSLATVPNDGSSAKAQFSDERVITDYKPGTNLGGVCEVGAASESVKKAKAILAACKLFARDNSGALPLELEELIPDYLANASQLVCPLCPSLKVGYDYFPASKEPPRTLDGPKQVVLQSKTPTIYYKWQVVYSDGEAEFQDERTTPPRKRVPVIPVIPHKPVNAPPAPKAPAAGR